MCINKLKKKEKKKAYQLVSDCIDFNKTFNSLNGKDSRKMEQKNGRLIIQEKTKI